MVRWETLCNAWIDIWICKKHSTIYIKNVCYHFVDDVHVWKYAQQTCWTKLDFARSGRTVSTRHGPSTQDCTRVQVPWMSMSTSTSTIFTQLRYSSTSPSTCTGTWVRARVQHSRVKMPLLYLCHSVQTTKYTIYVLLDKESGNRPWHWESWLHLTRRELII